VGNLFQLIISCSSTLPWILDISKTIFVWKRCELLVASFMNDMIFLLIISKQNHLECIFGNSLLMKI